jgi:hypothetical protein
VSEVELKVPPRLDELFRELRVFERNEKPLEVKVFAVFNYMGGSSYRATARKVTGEAIRLEASRHRNALQALPFITGP